MQIIETKLMRRDKLSCPHFYSNMFYLTEIYFTSFLPSICLCKANDIVPVVD